MWMIHRSIVLAALLTGPAMPGDLGSPPDRVGTSGEETPCASHATGPAAPDNCRAHGWMGYYGGYFAQVLWNDNSADEDGFTIEWSGPHHEHGTIDVPANDNQVDGLPSGRNFKYRVRAFNASGVSAWSQWAPVQFGGNA